MRLIFGMIGGILLMALASQAAAIKVDRLAAGSKIYTNVTILGANKTDLYFTHAEGIANVKLKHVEPALQKRFNYDAAAAAEAERQQAQEDSMYQRSLLSSLAARADQNAKAAKKKGRTSPESLADPVSEGSPLGKAGPALEFEKWLSDPPELKGKFVLLSFWAPWSQPSLKCIPELNALQKKLGDKLVIVGVTSDTEAEVEEVAQPRLEFASALDSKSKLRAAAGVTSVPCALLLNPKGILLYQGHPAGVSEARLHAIISKWEQEN